MIELIKRMAQLSVLRHVLHVITEGEEIVPRRGMVVILQPRGELYGIALSFWFTLPWRVWMLTNYDRSVVLCKQMLWASLFLFRDESWHLQLYRGVTRRSWMDTKLVRKLEVSVLHEVER